MAYRIFNFIVAALLWAPLPAAAAEPMEREGAWDLVYDDKSCDLTGVFGRKSNNVAVRFRQFEPGDEFDLSLIGERFVLSGPQPEEAEVDFGPTVNPRSTRVLMGRKGSIGVMMLGSSTLDDRRRSWDSPDIPPMSATAIAAVNSLAVSYHGRSVRLNLGSLAKPFAALRKCTQDLIRAWGYDPAAQSALIQPPKPTANPQTWLRSRDYPPVLLELGRGSRNVVRLDVDAAGRVTAAISSRRPRTQSSPG